MGNELRNIIATYERTRAVAKATFTTAYYTQDLELAKTCKETIELADKAIAETTSLLQLIGG